MSSALNVLDTEAEFVFQLSPRQNSDLLVSTSCQQKSVGVNLILKSFCACWSISSNSPLFQLVIPASYPTVATAHILIAFSLGLP